MSVSAIDRLIARETGQPLPTEPTTPALPWPTPAAELVVRPISWLARDMLLDGEYHLLAAPGGSYKSTVLFAIAGAVASGNPVLGGYPVERPRPVLLISEEDSSDVIRNRLDGFIQGHQWDAATVLANIHVLALEGARITDLAWQLHIEHIADELDVGLVCMDPLADLLQGDHAESSNELARPVIQWFRRLSKAGRATLVVHHHTKQSDQRQGQERARGASAWANGARGIFTVSEKDKTLWFGCDKMSRAPRPNQGEAQELTLVIEHQPGNNAMWVSANLALAYPPGDWRVTNPAELTKSEQTALQAMERHQGEPLSWSMWVKVSGLSESTLSLARARLLKTDMVEQTAAGTHAGRTRHRYHITGVGLARIYAKTGQLQVNSKSTPMELSQSTPINFNPPERGLKLMGLESHLGAASTTIPDGVGVGPGLDPWVPPDPSENGHENETDDDHGDHDGEG